MLLTTYACKSIGARVTFKKANVGPKRFLCTYISIVIIQGRTKMRFSFELFVQIEICKLKLIRERERKKLKKKKKREK